MLQLRTDCVGPLRNFIKNELSDRDGIVTCIFDTDIQFEKLDEMCLLPKDVMHIVYEYFNGKMTVDCSYDKRYTGIILFDISDNSNNKITYHYYLGHNMLIVDEKNFYQEDDSIMIISSSMNFFNLSRLYYHYIQNNDSIFETRHDKESTVTIDNNKYTITLYGITYVSVILNHEILKRRIDAMKQLIDIINPFNIISPTSAYFCM